MDEKSTRPVKNILIATDGSEGMSAVYTLALDLAKNLGAKLFGVYVVDFTPFAGMPEDEIIVQTKTKLYDIGWNVLNQLKRRALENGLEIDVILEEGAPAERILKVAKKLEVDMIILGTTGRSALDKILLGSVADYVIKNARCPVLAVRIQK
ncbi:MAG: universal stress protein [Thermoplasmata archaeon]